MHEDHVLFIPNEGCCKGHKCDNCHTCKRGRCCRRDNPGYQLPEFGDWDGPVYGKMGVLYNDGEKAECHVCGAMYGHLGAHVRRAHDLTTDEYRVLFGLRMSTGLIGPALQEKRRSAEALAHLAGVRPEVSNLFDITPEQRSAHASRKRPLETFLDPAKQAARKAASRRAHETKTRRRAAGLLPPVSMEQLRRPEVMARAQRASQETKKARSKDPQYKERIANAISAGRGGVATFECPYCGKIVVEPTWMAMERATCGERACQSRFKSEVMRGVHVGRKQPPGWVSPSKRPEVRAKISAAAKANSVSRRRLGNGQWAGGKSAYTSELDRGYSEEGRGGDVRGVGGRDE